MPMFNFLMNLDNPPLLVCFWIFLGFSVFLIGKIECVFCICIQFVRVVLLGFGFCRRNFLDLDCFVGGGHRITGVVFNF